MPKITEQQKKKIRFLTLMRLVTFEKPNWE